MKAPLASWLLLAAVGAPLLTALMLSARPWRRAVLRVTPLAALPALLLALVGTAGARVNLPWLGQHTMLELDLVGRVFLGFSSVLWLGAGWYAQAYLAKDASPARFHLFFLLAMAGNFSLVLAGDIPTFYAGYALMGLAAAGLVFHHGDTESVRAGRMYLTSAMVGEGLILTGFVFLIVTGGTIQIVDLHRGVFSRTALVLLLTGFGIKAGALSLHFWLPLAHPAAPVPASAVLSGAMIKTGLLGWIRFLPLGEAVIPGCGFALISAGLGAALLGTLVGVVQTNPKTVLAYSSISQMGIIMAGLGIGAIRPEAWLEIQTAIVIYTTHHALAKGALFLGIAPACAAQKRLEVAAARVGLLLPALALAGAPFTSGALAKTALKGNLAFLPDGWATALGILLPLAAVGTTLKMARFLWLTWPRRAGFAHGSASGLWLPWLGLVVAVLVGVWLLPGALEALPAKLEPVSLWDAIWPLLAGSALAALGAWLRRWFSGDLTRWLPAGDVGVFLERLLAALRRRVQDAAPFQHACGAGKRAVEKTSRWSARLAVAEERLARLEQRLGSDFVAGTLVLLLIGLIVCLLTVWG